MAFSLLKAYCSFAKKSWKLFGGGLLFCLMAAPAFADEYIGSKRFNSWVRHDLAEEAAQSFVELYAIEQGMRYLALDEYVQFAIEPGQGLSERELAGFASMLYQMHILEKGVETYPPEVHAFVHISATLSPGWRQRLAVGLGNRELAKVYGRIEEERRKNLAQYELLAGELFALSTSTPTGRSKAMLLQNVVERLRGLRMFHALLDGYDVKWADPKAAYEALHKLLVVDQHNYLYRTAAAEALLQLDRAAEAQLEALEAIRLAPDYPKAHDIHGSIMLRQQLPVLASQAFTEAIALSPMEPRYRLQRAAAFLVQEDIVAMCQDLRIACVYGQCEQYTWARRNGKCQPDEDLPITDKELEQKLRDLEES